MKLRYSYHSEHNADRQDRWIHFVLYLGALALLLAAAQQLLVHFFGWESSTTGYWHLTLPAIYLIVAAVLAFLGGRARNASRGEADRYVRIDDERILWHLTQVDAETSVALANIERVDRRTIRDLVLTLESGEEKVLPIYLIANHEKQEELLRTLWHIVPKG